MPVSAPERTTQQRPIQTKWVTPFGVVAQPAQPRVDPPRFIYRGNADEHLRGQGCYPDAESLSSRETVSVIMACGCRLTVAWWMLEPVKP